LPYILKWSAADDAIYSQCRNLGTRDYITKPLNYELLVHRMRYMLRTSQTIAQPGTGPPSEMRGILQEITDKQTGQG
jgi:DNA-binding response OmpR family regulator